MTFEIGPGTIAIGCVALIVLGVWLEQMWLAALATIALVVSTITYCESRPEAVAERQRIRAEEARLAQPHVIREADGCKVYGWKDGSWHYFTRCSVPGTVTTDRNYTVDVKCGKNCTRQEPRTETIVTEEK